MPEEVKDSLKRVVEDSKDDLKNKGSIKRERMEYLFKIYNRYLAGRGNSEDVNCMGCRVKVWGKLVGLVDLVED